MTALQFINGTNCSEEKEARWAARGQRIELRRAHRDRQEWALPAL